MCDLCDDYGRYSCCEDCGAYVCKDAETDPRRWVKMAEVTPEGYILCNECAQGYYADRAEQLEAF